MTVDGKDRMVRAIGRGALVVVGVALVVGWIWTATTSHDSTPWYNEWLVTLGIFAVVVVVGFPRLVFPGFAAWEDDGHDHSTLRHLIVYAVLFVGGVWVLMGLIRTVEASPTPAIGRVDGRDVAVVAYDRWSPQGWFQLIPGWAGLQHVVAVDVATGHHLWDVTIQSDEFYEARVIAAGEKYAYVANLDGLRILDLRTGAVVAGPARIEGMTGIIGEAEWYGYDDERGLVLAVVEGGGLDVIPIDETVGERATDEVYDEWRPQLPESVTSFSEEDLAEIGASAGYRVVDGNPDGSGHELSTVDTRTGRVIDSIIVPEGPSAGATAPSGASVLTLGVRDLGPAYVVLISPTGELSLSTIGRQGILGEGL